MLKSSTDANPTNAKLNASHSCSKREMLWVPLPWVKTGKHLRNRLSSKCDGMKSDICVKRAMFIDKNNVLNQEFGFSHPFTKVKMNLLLL